MEREPGACQVNFSDHTPPYPAPILRACDAYYFAHEFVAERSVEIVIPAQNFDVRIAYPREAQANERPAGSQPWQRFLNHSDAISACDRGKHRKNIGAQAINVRQLADKFSLPHHQRQIGIDGWDDLNIGRKNRTLEKPRECGTRVSNPLEVGVACAISLELVL